MGNLLNQMGLLIRFRFLGLEDTQQNVPAGFHVYRYHDTHSPVKVVPTYMHGQGPCDKCRLLSCLTNTLSVARSSHIYRQHLVRNGLGSLYRDTYVSDGAQGFTQPTNNTSTENMCSIQNHRPSG